VVADSYNNQIRVISLTTDEVRTVAGIGSAGLKDGLGSSSEFSEPSGLAFNSDGSLLYVADSDNNCIRRISLSKIPVSLVKDEKPDDMNLHFNAPATVTRIAGNTSAGASDGPVSNSLSTVTFNRPMGLALDNKRHALYIADSLSHSIRVLNTTTGAVTTLAGQGKAGYKNGLGKEAMFNTPHSVACSPDGRYVFVADTYNHRIRRIDVLTGATATIAGNGVGRYRDGEGSAIGEAVQSAGSLDSPMGVAACPNGRCVVVSDHHNRRIRVIDLASAHDVRRRPGGLPTTRILPHRDFNVTSDTPHNQTFNYMYDVNVEEDLYSAKIRTLAGSGSETVDKNADGPGKFSAFQGPAGLDFRPSNDYLLVADREGNRIRRIAFKHAKPTTPVGPLLYSVGSTSLSISWTASVAIPIVDRYEIQYRGFPETNMDSALEWQTAVRIAQDGTAYYRPSATIYDLHTNRRYGVRLRARNHIGWSDWSMETIFTTAICGQVPVRWVHGDGSSHSVGHDLCEDQNRNHQAVVRLTNTAGHDDSAAPVGANPYMHGPGDERRDGMYTTWTYPKSAGSPPPPVSAPPPPPPGPGHWISELDGFNIAAGLPGAMSKATITLAGVTPSQFAAAGVQLGFQKATAAVTNVHYTKVTILSSTSISFGSGTSVEVSIDAPRGTAVSGLASALSTSAADTSAAGFAQTMVTEAASAGSTISKPTVVITSPLEMMHDPHPPVPSLR